MSIQEHNDKLNELFEKDKPFSLVRIGAMEGFFLEAFFNGVQLPEHLYRALYYVAGVYPVTDDYLKSYWLDYTVSAIHKSDIVGFVDIPETIKNNKPLLNCIGSEKELFFKDDIAVLNPTQLVNLDNPWTKNLKGKRVLVISSHRESILSQWKNIHNVWKFEVDNITPFDLVGVIRAPFNPETDVRQYPECYMWHETLYYMCNLIDSYEYDVLLVGAGAFSPILAAYAKSKDKIGITLCGDIQLLFGILGVRWKDYENDKNKDAWIYPLEVDLPENRCAIETIEKSYWK